MQTKRKHAYIFDLYATLIDIRTDEHSLSFWKAMAQYYARCGAYFGPAALRKTYLRMVGEEQEKLREKTHLAYPEIDLANVFRRLLLEGPSRPGASVRPDMSRPGQSLTETGAPDEARQKDRSRLAQDPSWLQMTAHTFRSYSMRRFGLFPGTLQTLRALRAQGNGVCLLSNAQSLFTRPELEMTGLLPCFDAVYISSERGMKKPQPEFMRLLLDEQGLDPSDCTMVGNEIGSDVAVALSCGVEGCLLNTDHIPDDKIDRQFSPLLEKYPGAHVRQIRSGRIRELL